MQFHMFEVFYVFLWLELNFLTLAAQISISTTFHNFELSISDNKNAFYLTFHVWAAMKHQKFHLRTLDMRIELQQQLWHRQQHQRRIKINANESSHSCVKFGRALLKNREGTSITLNDKSLADCCEIIFVVRTWMEINVSDQDEKDAKPMNNLRWVIGTENISCVTITLVLECSEPAT